LLLSRSRPNQQSEGETDGKNKKKSWRAAVAVHRRHHGESLEEAPYY
jgi:hypothetical protein